ncbi:MAG: single-stranded DNA-binding protein [Xanthobacteraceae bacterium]
MSIEAALFGTLGRDAESKTSKAGKAYLRLNVAYESGDATQWVNVMAFDPRAIENAAGFVKGARCYVEGKLSLSEWTSQDGTTHHGLSLMSWHCRLSAIGRAKPKREKLKPADIAIRTSRWRPLQ